MIAILVLFYIKENAITILQQDIMIMVELQSLAIQAVHLVTILSIAQVVSHYFYLASDV
jgi:hypothetical protein